MATLSGLIDRVRLELSDEGRRFTEKLRGELGVNEFQLEHFPVDADAVTVWVNGDIVPSTEVGIEERTGLLIFDAEPTKGVEIKVSGVHFSYFATNDLAEIVSTAVTEHLHNRTDDFGTQLNIVNLPPVEDYVVALLATIQALYALATDSAFDIDIAAPDGVTIPRSERYRQLQDMILTRQGQYLQLCEALNIGLARVEVYTLRRIAKSTGRYIPLFRSKEVDDPTPPERIWLSIPTNGGEPFPTSQQKQDLELVQGEGGTFTFVAGFDLTGYNLKAQIRPFPEAAVVVLDFAVTVSPTDNTAFVLTVTPDQTRYLPLRAFWDIQMIDKTDATKVLYPVGGVVFTQRRVTAANGSYASGGGVAIDPPWLSGTAQTGFTDLTGPRY